MLKIVCSDLLYINRHPMTNFVSPSRKTHSSMGVKSNKVLNWFLGPKRLCF